MTPSHVMQLIPEAKKTQFSVQSRSEARKQHHHRSQDALISHYLEDDEHLRENVSLPSMADPEEENLLKPKTLLEHCKMLRSSWMSLTLTMALTIRPSIS